MFLQQIIENGAKVIKQENFLQFPNYILKGGGA
jgi:hypothetical protein